MSLEDLTRVEVTSVSKSPQLLNTAAAAIYVITHDEIVRSGVLSIPEALRLAPNLQVEQVSASSYAISARGFNDSREVQTQANKLLILVDGRTVYSPLFSGVFYDAIDLMMDDIDRIEVISGPGATLWGANAMNGVINIITRSVRETGGTLVRLDSGSAEQAASARYGGRMGDALAFRVYGKAFDRHSLERADGSDADDRWNKRQGGFRVDWDRASHAFTLQGDAFHAEQDFPGAPDLAGSGENLLARWEQKSERSQLSVQVYYDHTAREAPPDGAAFSLDTYDLEIQHAVAVGSRHRIVWGAGTRLNEYDIMSSGGLQFQPAHRSLNQENLFLQDTVSLFDTIKLTAGLKLEDNAYSGWSTLPDLRLAWAPSESTLLWLAASRAIRAPTPFDVDVAEFFGPILFLRGNPDFKSEKSWAYEVGYRGQPAPAIAFSLSAFYDQYEDLRTVEFGPAPIPFAWGNQMSGNTYGLEAWANIQVRPWWRLSPGFRSLHKRLHFAPGASELVGLQLAGNDPTQGASLKSSMDLGRAVTLDAFLRHNGELSTPENPDYYELSARLAWRVSTALELSISGFNLLHERHTEYPVPIGAAIERSAFAEARITF